MKTKFHVFTNLAISMDGKISTRHRELFSLGSSRDHYFMDVHRARAHAVLMGAGTLRAFKNPVKIKRKQFYIKREALGLRRHPLNIVIATHLDFDTTWPFFTDPSVERILVVPPNLSERKTKPFQGFAHIFRSSNPKKVPQEIIQHLKKQHQCKNLLLEGGGGTIFPFVAANLIDEWNVTLTPKIVGGADAPTMVDGEGFLMDEIKQYHLKKVLRFKDELFLNYIR